MGFLHGIQANCERDRSILRRLFPDSARCSWRPSRAARRVLPSFPVVRSCEACRNGEAGPPNRPLSGATGSLPGDRPKGGPVGSLAFGLGAERFAWIAASRRLRSTATSRDRTSGKPPCS